MERQQAVVVGLLLITVNKLHSLVEVEPTLLQLVVREQVVTQLTLVPAVVLVAEVLPQPTQPLMEEQEAEALLKLLLPLLVNQIMVAVEPLVHLAVLVVAAPLVMVEVAVQQAPQQQQVLAPMAQFLAAVELVEEQASMALTPAKVATAAPVG